MLPNFTDEQAANIAKQKFGITGELARLNGERDLNIRIKNDDLTVVFKIANSEEDKEMLLCQHEVFALIGASTNDLAVPESILSLQGQVVEQIESVSGQQHNCRMVRYLDGTLFSSINPHTAELLESLGETVAHIDSALQSFKNPAIGRALLWNMTNALDTLEKFAPLLTDNDNRQIINHFQQRYINHVLPLSGQIRFSAIHNDANDNNILVESSGPSNQRVKGIIDYGDMVYSWTVVDLAVAAAYAILDKSKPLDAAISVVAGYHRVFALTEIEISILYDLIAMRLCLSGCIGVHQQSCDPENEYLRISEVAVWSALKKWILLSAEFTHHCLRDACGFMPVPTEGRVVNFLKSYQKSASSIVDFDLNKAQLFILDTSVSSPQLPSPGEAFDPVKTTKALFSWLDEEGFAAAIGRYDEYRLIYDSDSFVDSMGYRRTLHLGIDIFMPAGKPLYAPIAGKIYGVANNDAPLDYGGTLILEHGVTDEQGDLRFYSLYGHLKVASISAHQIGHSVNQGQKIAETGEIYENGNWVPHVHFQIITDMLGETGTFVGVGSHAYRNVWLSMCPDPNFLLGIADIAKDNQTKSPKALIHELGVSRKTDLNPSLSLSYQEPLHIVRGSMQYLYDYTGKRYLDAVNNVPHVGHCHPKVVAAERQQAGILNTNTRYLYSAITSYSERLLEKLPEPLNVCFLVNSGSEANDLALRLARNYTGRRDMVVLDNAYHGNLSSLIEISPYKHNSKGGHGTPEGVHVAKMPDPYRGAYQYGEANMLSRYVDSVNQILQDSAKTGIAGFISESALGCGGQVFLPDDYLRQIYLLVREAGGLCIADEVQVGFGRVGSHFWAFETQNVIPDIVTLGKPMGNGHPLGAVITTREIADAFNNGMEYFNTFGGNPISCAIGSAVLDVLKEEHLQHKASETGSHFLDKLNELKSVCPVIGDVRGRGLFIGIELVDDAQSLSPGAVQAKYISERMKQNGILISTDGPWNNVLKIKPPLCFNSENADQFVDTLSVILKENFAQPGLDAI